MGLIDSAREWHRWRSALSNSAERETVYAYAPSAFRGRSDSLIDLFFRGPKEPPSVIAFVIICSLCGLSTTAYLAYGLPVALVFAVLPSYLLRSYRDPRRWPLFLLRYADVGVVLCCAAVLGPIPLIAAAVVCVSSMFALPPLPRYLPCHLRSVDRIEVVRDAAAGAAYRQGPEMKLVLDGRTFPLSSVLWLGFSTIYYPKPGPRSFPAYVFTRAVLVLRAEDGQVLRCWLDSKSGHTAAEVADGNLGNMVRELAALCDVPPQLEGQLPREYEVVSRYSPLVSLVSLCAAIGLVLAELLAAPPQSSAERLLYGFGIFASLVGRDVILAQTMRLAGKSYKWWF